MGPLVRVSLCLRTPAEATTDKVMPQYRIERASVRDTWTSPITVLTQITVHNRSIQFSIQTVDTCCA
jgi:hypothetical protein